MALTGVHVTCSYVTIISGVGLVAGAAWSETIGSPGATTNTAKNPARMPSRGDGLLIFEVSSATDAYVAVGTNPDATQANGAGDAARTLIRGGADPRPIACVVGDKLAWLGA
jgi:hypothetical protein